MKELVIELITRQEDCYNSFTLILWPVESLSENKLGFFYQNVYLFTQHIKLKQSNRVEHTML